MKFTCSRTELAAALRFCASIADAKGAMPALSMVRLTASGTSLMCSATDITTTVTVKVACSKASGDVLAPAAQLAKAIDVMPGGEVEIVVDKTAIVARTGKSKQVVPLGPGAESFPTAPAIDAEWNHVSASALAFVMRGCMPAICLDETRFHLHGIMVASDGGTMLGQATDGHRAHVMRYPCDATIPRGIVPAKACKEILSMIEPVDAVEMACSRSYRHFRAGATTLSVKLIDAEFPPFDGVTPSYNGAGVVVDRAALLGAMKRASTATSDSTGVSIRVNSDGVTFESHTAGFRAEDSIDVDTGGTVVATSVNPKFLTDSVKVIAGDSIALRFGGPLDPFTVTAAGDNLTNVSGTGAILMPMRTA